MPASKTVAWAMLQLESALEAAAVLPPEITALHHAGQNPSGSLVYWVRGGQVVHARIGQGEEGVALADRTYLDEAKDYDHTWARMEGRSDTWDQRPPCPLYVLDKIDETAIAIIVSMWEGGQDA